MNLDLADRMTSARRVVRLRRVSCPHTVAEAYEVQYLFFGLHKLLFETLNLNFLLLVFKDLQLLVVVE
jgi:hypothetical protein